MSEPDLSAAPIGNAHAPPRCKVEADSGVAAVRDPNWPCAVTSRVVAPDWRGALTLDCCSTTTKRAQLPPSVLILYLPFRFGPLQAGCGQNARGMQRGRPDSSTIVRKPQMSGVEKQTVAPPQQDPQFAPRGQDSVRLRCWLAA